VIILITILLSLIANLCLAQNYTTSLIPGIHDGIGISNPVARLVIGEDGWSKDLFKNYFVNSVYLTIVLVAAFAVTYFLEAKRSGGKSV
jgi:hypothetical protein